MREYRTFHNVEVRAAGTGPNGRPVIDLQAVRPFVVDDYGSMWMPDTFDAGIQQRTAVDADDTPALCWAHRWEDPIGHGIAYEASSTGPRVRFELDDFDAVPRAKQADAQVRSKTIRDCSVGFSNAERRDPTDDERKQYPGIREVIYRADLDEVSLVLRGAVPGAKVLSVRSAAGAGTVTVDFVIDLAKRIAADEMTHDEAKAALALVADGQQPPEAAETAPEAPESDEQPDDAADLGQDIDGALAVLDGRNL